MRIYRNGKSGAAAAAESECGEPRSGPEIPLRDLPGDLEQADLAGDAPGLPAVPAAADGLAQPDLAATALTLKEIIDAAIEARIGAHRGDLLAAARSLGINRETIYRHRRRRKAEARKAGKS